MIVRKSFIGGMFNCSTTYLVYFSAFPNWSIRFNQESQTKGKKKLEENSERTLGMLIYPGVSSALEAFRLPCNSHSASENNQQLRSFSSTFRNKDIPASLISILSKSVERKIIGKFVLRLIFSFQEGAYKANMRCYIPGMVFIT